MDIHWSEEDGAYIAEVYDLPGCMADGETEEEAAAHAREAVALWLEVAQSEGRAVPPPSNLEAPSGKLNVRLPIWLHQELQKRARREEVSLNTLMVSLLADRRSL